jgi:cytochrome P450
MHPWIDWMFELIETATMLRALSYYPSAKNILLRFVPASLRQGRKNHVELMTAKARHRLNMKTDRVDFMTRMAHPNAGLTEAEFIASADTVLLGGSETTSTLLSGITYYLTKNPEILKKLVEEIRSNFDSEEEITFTRVSQFKYMLACIDEAFRIYPPVPGALPRRTTRPESIAGNDVPPNVSITFFWRIDKAQQEGS